MEHEAEILYTYVMLWAGICFYQIFIISIGKPGIRKEKEGE